MIKPLILISIPDTLDAYKVILSKLLGYRDKYQTPLGIELYISDSQELANKIRLLKRVLNKYNIPLAINLPVLKESDLNKLISFNYLKPVYIVTQGYVSDNGESGNYLNLCSKTVATLSSINSDNELLIKNSVYPTAGIFTTDLLKISQDADCGIFIDTEALLHSISAIRKWSRSSKAVPSNKEEKECYEQYGFFVRSGKILCPLKSLKTLTLEDQLAQIKAERYHISGSNTVITDKSMIKQSEIQDAPFHRYLVSTVLNMQPKSITIKSYCSDGTHNLDIVLRSLRNLLDFLFKNQIKGVSK